MTGYGAAEAGHEGVRVKVELRSVNHRFFDPAIRISRGFAGSEGRVRERLSARISRGRISASIDVQSEDGAVALVLDEVMAEEYRAIFATLAERHDMQPPADAAQFAQLPDVVRREVRTLDPEAVDTAIDRAVEEALEQLLAMREYEGRALGKDLTARVKRIDGLLERIGLESGDAVERARTRLQERIAQLVPDGARVDEDRLATEVALIADKADITEELVRFRAHDEAFLAFLVADEPVGKRLDFLLQEMNREVNTIGSKTANAGVAHLVVEVKEEIERLREQVQNVE